MFSKSKTDRFSCRSAEKEHLVAVDRDGKLLLTRYHLSANPYYQSLSGVRHCSTEKISKFNPPGWECTANHPTTETCLFSTWPQSGAPLSVLQALRRQKIRL